jgi:hypothetical protein
MHPERSEAGVLVRKLSQLTWCGNTWQEPDLLIPGDLDSMTERSGRPFVWPYWMRSRRAWWRSNRVVDEI